MKGLVKIRSLSTEMSHYDFPKTSVKFSVYYTDGHTISAEMTIPIFSHSHSEIMIYIKQYYKGDLAYR